MTRRRPRTLGIGTYEAARTYAVGSATRLTGAWVSDGRAHPDPVGPLRLCGAPARGGDNRAASVHGRIPALGGGFLPSFVGIWTVF